MRYLSLFLALAMFCCGPSREAMFSAYDEQDQVKIILEDHGLEEVPPQIAELKHVKELQIIRKSEWKVYPPSPYWPEKVTFEPPFRKLPPEILELKNLRKLSLTDLDLNQLPAELGKLENLEELDISFNKLDIEKEKHKLMMLPNLKKLTLYMNSLDTASLKNWMAEAPGLTIVYKWQ